LSFYNLAKTDLVSAPKQAVPGLPVYALGNLNRTVAPTRMRVTNIAASAGTCTLTVLVIEGQIPVVNQLVSVTGFPTTGALAPFNITNAKITAVSAAATPDVGVYTISFASVSSIISQAAAAYAIAPQIETGTTIAVNNGSTATANASASEAISIQENVNPANAKTIRADVTFPTVPTTCTVALQTAALDFDSEYVTLGTVASVTGSTVTGQTVMFAAVEALFARFLITGFAGAGAVIAKITI
jgi:hypothetical protein